jgi:hypothetical protein
MSRTAEVARRVGIPWRTADRALQELTLLGCLWTDQDEHGKWLYAPVDGVADVLKTIASFVGGT